MQNEIKTPPKTKLNMEQPLSDLARQVGSELRAAPIFLFGNIISAVNETGEITPMTPARFVTWAGKYITFTRYKNEERVAVEIGTDIARLILACDGFRSQLQVMEDVPAELEDVIAAIVGEAPLESPPVLTTADIIERATADAMLGVITSAKEPKRAIGHKMNSLKGRRFTDTQGRVFVFGDMDHAKGANYPITFLKPL